MERLGVAFNNYRWVRIVSGLGLLLYGVLLYILPGGFPPWAWRFLAHVVPQLSQLQAVQGSAIFLPLLGLILLSLSLCILWGVWLAALCKMILYYWQAYHAHQNFLQDMAAAEQLSETMLATRQPSNPALPPLAAHAPVSQPAQAVAQPQRTAVSTARLATWEQQETHQAFAVSRASRAGNMVASAGGGGRPIPLAIPDQPTLHPGPVVPPSTSRSVMREQLRIVPREDDVEIFDIPANSDQTNPYPEGELLFGAECEDDEEEYQLPEDTSLRLVAAIGLDPGLARKDHPNQDNLFAIQAMRATPQGQQPVGLFIVADGMGGHANGQEASRLAVQTISDLVVPAMLRVNEDEDDFSELLRDGIHRANLALYQRNRQQPEMMGTTVTAALVVNTTAYIANVGDSRTYRYRAGEGLKQITRDHSVVARLVEDGVISREDVYEHPKRNQIYRCLGEHSTVEIDSFVETVQATDVLLLCSDGLWEMVRDPDINKIITSSATHPSQISSMLVQAALSGGGADNISVVVVMLSQHDQ